MALTTRVYEPEGGKGDQTIVLAHGFTQNRNCWGSLAEILALRHRVICVDLPGHGRSGHDDATLEHSARLLAEVGGAATYVGYSMGGRIALHLAIQNPSPALGLVLIGVNPGIEDPERRKQRALADAQLADRLVHEGLGSFLESWLQNPLFDGLSPEAAALEERRTNRVEGLTSSLRVRSVGRQQPLWAQAGNIEIPVLLIAGESDTTYRESNAKLLMHLRQGTSMVVPGSHPVHLQSPRMVAEAIEAHIDDNSNDC